MPELISTTQIQLEWKDLESWTQRLQPPNARVRSSGVHLSGVIRYVLQSIGKLKAEDESDDMPMVVALGMAVENWLMGLRENHGIIWQPGEWECDGVYGTPDGLTMLPKAYQLEEVKFTYKSEHTKGKEEILNQSIWIWQLAANCYALTEQLGRPVRTARLHVVWANGDYRSDRWPKYMQYVIGFEEQELEEFWKKVVLANKDAEGVRKEQYNEDKERSERQ